MYNKLTYDAVLFRRNCCWILWTGRYLWIAVWSYQLGFQGRLWWDASVELVHFAVVICWNARRHDTFSRIFPIFGTCTFEVRRVYCGIGNWPKLIMSAIELSAGSCWSLFSVLLFRCVLHGCVPKKILVYGSAFRAEFQVSQSRYFLFLHAVWPGKELLFITL